MDTAELQLRHFEPLVDETFIADFAEDGPVELVLTEAIDRPTGNTSTVAFSLLFHGGLDRVFDQGLVALRHHTLGRHSLFLVPVAEDQSGRTYEAVFARIVD